MRNRYRTEEYAINNGDYRTSSPQMEIDEIAQIKAYVDQQDQLIVAQHNADKITQESRDIEQNNQIFQNATDIAINQTSIANLTNKNTEQDGRLDVISTEQITQNNNIAELQARPISDVDKLYVDTADTNLQLQINELKERPDVALAMYELVQEVMVEADTTSFVFQDLDAINDCGYALIFDSAEGKINTSISILLNGDVDSTDYAKTYMANVTGVTNDITSGNNDADSIFASLDAGVKTYNSLDISANGLINNSRISNNKHLDISGIYKKTTITNVNQIEIRASIANGIPSGTRIYLFRKKMKEKEVVLLEQNFVKNQAVPLDLNGYDKLIVESELGVWLTEIDVATGDFFITMKILWSSGGESVSNPILERMFQFQYLETSKTLTLMWIKDIETRDGGTTNITLNPINNINLKVVGKRW